MKNLIKIFLIFITCLIVVACSDTDNNVSESKKDHVWKEQTDTIDKAKEVEGMLMDSAEKTHKILELQN